MLTKKESFNVLSNSLINETAIRMISLRIMYDNNKRFISDQLPREIQREVDGLNQQNTSQISEENLMMFTQTLSHYYGLSQETENVLSNFLIVAAFSFFEKGLKKLLELTNMLTDKELRACYKKNDAIKICSDKFGIDYKSLTGFTLVEELRCLNNDIKHSGYVGQELVSANSKWGLSNLIGNTYDDFIRLNEGPQNLLEDLKNGIEPHLK